VSGRVSSTSLASCRHPGLAGYAGIAAPGSQAAEAEGEVGGATEVPHDLGDLAGVPKHSARLGG